MKALGYRLFRAGRMPAGLATMSTGSSVLLSDEGLSVKFTSHGLRAPGRRTALGVRLHVGAIVVSTERIAVSIGKTVVIDSAYGHDRTPLSFSIDAEGVQLHLDIGAALPGGAGKLDITVRTEHELAGATPGPHYATITAVEAAALTKWA